MKSDIDNSSNYNSYCCCKLSNIYGHLNRMNDMIECDCGEEHKYYEWKWDDQNIDSVSVSLSENEREVFFHKIFSSGTAAVKGTIPFKQNYHYYWEIKMLTPLYGTDVMVGIGTSKVNKDIYPYQFCSLLGMDTESWGYSYRGMIQHNGKKQEYGARFGLGSLIGIHLDMCMGSCEFFVNRMPMGVAFTGLKNKQLYPMICSTAAQSAMRLTCAMSIEPNLQLLTIQNLLKDSVLYEMIDTVPCLRKILMRQFWWLLYSTEDQEKHELYKSNLRNGKLMNVKESYKQFVNERKRKRENGTSSAQLTDGPTSSQQLQIQPS